MKKIITAVVCSTFSMAFAGETTGPGAKLYKLSAKWVSILPATATENVNSAATETAATNPATNVNAAPAGQIPTAVAPVAAQIPGYTPAADYSGSCHITVNLQEKTYVINKTSSTSMLKNQGENSVCLPTERLAIEYGFNKAR